MIPRRAAGRSPRPRRARPAARAPQRAAGPRAPRPAPGPRGGWARPRRASSSRTVALYGVTAQASPRSAGRTSGRSPWFSRPSQRAPETAESASTRPSGATMVTRASTSRAALSTRASRSAESAPRARAGSTTRAIRRASARSVVARLLEGAPAQPGLPRGGGRRPRPPPPQPRRSTTMRVAQPTSVLLVAQQTVAQRLYGDDRGGERRGSSRAGAARARPPCACPPRRSSPRRPRAGPAGESTRPFASRSATSRANSLAVRCTGCPSSGRRGAVRSTSRGPRTRRGLVLGLALQPPEERAHARHQLLGAERLHHVVVRAHLQAHDAVGLVPARGEHDHGHVLRPAVAAHLRAEASPSRPGSWRSRITAGRLSARSRSSACRPSSAASTVQPSAVR